MFTAYPYTISMEKKDQPENLPENIFSDLTVQHLLNGDLAKLKFHPKGTLVARFQVTTIQL